MHSTGFSSIHLHLIHWILFFFRNWPIRMTVQTRKNARNFHSATLFDAMLLFCDCARCVAQLYFFHILSRVKSSFEPSFFCFRSFFWLFFPLRWLFSFCSKFLFYIYIRQIDDVAPGNIKYLSKRNVHIIWSKCFYTTMKYVLIWISGVIVKQIHNRTAQNVDSIISNDATNSNGRRLSYFVRIYSFSLFPFCLWFPFLLTLSLHACRLFLWIHLSHVRRLLLIPIMVKVFFFWRADKNEFWCLKWACYFDDIKCAKMKSVCQIHIRCIYCSSVTELCCSVWHRVQNYKCLSFDRNKRRRKKQQESWQQSSYEFSTFVRYIWHVEPCWSQHAFFVCIPLWFVVVNTRHTSSCDANVFIKPKCNLYQCFYESIKNPLTNANSTHILCIWCLTLDGNHHEIPSNKN